MPANADPAVVGEGPVSLPPQAVQMQGVRVHEAYGWGYVSREEERRRERAREREREHERELRRQKEAAPPKQVRLCMRRRSPGLTCRAHVHTF